MFHELSRSTIHPVRNSTAEVKGIHAVTHGIERVPADIIKDVVINSHAVRALYPQLQFLASEKYITENIHRVIGNGDEVIYFYRVTGVTERYEQGKNPDDIKDHLYKMRYVSRRNREFARAARLMRLQLESLDPFGSKEIVETYETVGRGEKISWEQFDFFNEGLIRLFQANIRSLYEVYIRHINRGVYIRDFADVLAEARDWDFSFLSQDFEMAKKTNIQARDNTLYNLEIYTRRYAGLVSHKVPSILRSFVVPSIVSDPQLERICFDDLYWTRLTAQFSERLGAAV